MQKKTQKFNTHAKLQLLADSRCGHDVVESREEMDEFREILPPSELLSFSIAEKFPVLNLESPLGRFSKV